MKWSTGVREKNTYSTEALVLEEIRKRYVTRLRRVPHLPLKLD